MNAPTVPTEYAGKFEPLPAEIRAQNPDMIGWEFAKAYPTPSRWILCGWNVFNPDGIQTYDLDGMCIRDRVMYR